MAMEVIEIGGKEYVKSRDAAKKTGYTTDYIGQLCRAGEIDARMVGRSWYVDIDDLTEHRKEKKRSSRIKAREEVKKTLAVQTDVVDEPHWSTAYSTDEGDLMPVIHKPEPEAPHSQTDEAENKVTVPVVATDDFEEEKTHVTKRRYTGESVVADVPRYGEETAASDTIYRPQYAETTTSAGSEEKEEGQASSLPQRTAGKSRTHRLLLKVVLILLFSTLGIGAFFLEVVWVATDTGVSTRYGAAPSDFQNMLKNLDISF